MDDYSLAQTLLAMARRDCFDNVGRLLVSDVQSNVDRSLTAEKILQVWEQYFPSYDTDQRSDNVILVYWEGRDTVKNVRLARDPVVPGHVISHDKEDETVVK